MGELGQAPIDGGALGQQIHQGRKIGGDVIYTLVEADALVSVASIQGMLKDREKAAGAGKHRGHGLQFP